VLTGALEKQLILKKIFTPEDWNKISNNVLVEFNHDNYYSELKELEVQQDRMQLMNMADPMVGKYISKKWAMKNVLQLTDEEMTEELNQIQEEINSGEVIDPNEMLRMQMAAQMPQEDAPAEDDSPQPRNEETISDEEKKLVESMTKFMESMTDEE